MRDYLTAGKRKGSLEPYSVSPEDAYLVNEVHDGFHLKGKIIKRSVIIGVSLKEATIEDCDFSYTTFINCYFRGAKFKGSNFTGCKFYECNFRSASIINCQLMYSKWKETYIKKETVLANLPSYDGIAQELLMNLRMNASSIGEYEDARYYLYESEALSRSHLRKIITKYSDYYNKYSILDRVKATFSLARSYGEKFFWGYGEKPGTLTLSAFIVITAFAFIYLIKEPLLFRNPSNGSNIVDEMIAAEKLSLSVFSGNTPVTLAADVVSKLSSIFIVESLFGLVFIAFLAASLHRKISTRRD